MGKKKSKKPIIRPWCWYCEREFEDEKVLMQHQKAKHFKCKMCPRRLNTAGGLAVHIQQVHKLEPENLPRIENALPGRDGYEVEIFGMEGIPAPDVADYKRRKEIELGLNPGTITQPPAKRPKIENRVLTETELKIQLEAHKALMGASESSAPAIPDAASGAVFNAAPQAYAAPVPPSVIPPVPLLPPGAPPFIPPGAPPLAGAPPFPPPFPGGPGFPPVPPPGSFQFPPGHPGFPPGMVPPPGVLPVAPGASPPQGAAGVPPFAPPGAPVSGPIPAPAPGLPPAGVPAAASPGPPPPRPALSQAPPTFVPATGAAPSAPKPAEADLSNVPARASSTPFTHEKPPLPNPALKQINPDMKKGVLKYIDPNYSQEENRALDSRYYFSPIHGGKSQDGSGQEESRGKKRARAEDFL